MKINLKARMKNKVFLLSAAAMILALVYQVLSMAGITPSITQNEVAGVITAVLNILAFLGIVVDPTTDGVCDSERALTYFTENDVRNICENVVANSQNSASEEGAG